MPSYAEWKRMNESDDPVEHKRAVWVHVTLYDSTGTPSLIRGEMVERKLESGQFFPEPPPDVEQQEMRSNIPTNIDADVDESLRGPQPKFPNVSTRRRRRRS